MGYNCVVLCVLLAVCVRLVEPYPNGAPHVACATLMPNHTAVNPQPAPNPYGITITGGVTTYEPGTQVKVKITGMGEFKGLFIQARNNQDAAMGTFEDPESASGNKLKLRPCPDKNGPKNGVTHTNASANMMQPGSFELVWNPPPSDKGDISFKATVAQGRSKYWLGATSATLKYAGNSGPRILPSHWIVFATLIGFIFRI